jgi:lambda family phage minor tail protein L
MSIAQDLTQLEVSGKIELLVIDAASVGGQIYYFVNGINALLQPVVWQGQVYQPFPIEATGFDLQSTGPMPRPKLSASNVLSLIGVLIRDYKRLEGCKVVRKRTLIKYLDAVNFPGSINPTADPNAFYPDDIYFIDRVLSRNKTQVQWELASPMDVAGVQLPRRPIQARACWWGYRSTECGYTGGAVATADDTPTSTPALDSCGHRLSSCKLRFGAYAELPFGGFPGAGIIRNA